MWCVQIWGAFFTAKAQKCEPLPAEAQALSQGMWHIGSQILKNFEEAEMFWDFTILKTSGKWLWSSSAGFLGPPLSPGVSTWLGRKPAGLQPSLDRTWSIMNTRHFPSWPHPFLQFTFLPSPFPPFLFLYSQICPTPFLSVPLALCTFFRSTHPPLPPITHAVCAPPTLPASTGAQLHSLQTTENIQSHQPHTHDPLCLCTHTSCVCVSPFTLPSSTSPLTSPPSLQLSSSLPELTLSLAFALTGQSPRAERPHLLFDLSPSLLSLASSLQPLTHSSAVQPSG